MRSKTLQLSPLLHVSWAIMLPRQRPSLLELDRKQIFLGMSKISLALPFNSLIVKKYRGIISEFFLFNLIIFLFSFYYFNKRILKPKKKRQSLRYI